MSTDEATSNEATLTRIQEALRSGDWELISKTTDELVEPDALIRTPLPIEATRAESVGYAEVDGALLVGTGVKWRRNIRRGVPVRVLVRGREILTTTEVIMDEQRCAELDRHVLARNPMHGRFAQIWVGPDGDPDRDDLRRALGRGIAIVRFTSHQNDA